MTFSTTDLLATAARVIATEADALVQLSQNLGPSFVAAAQMMLSANGRVIVTGMGKSGHIGRKIASTLASTGTPAHFVHPAEASHGDLGMLTRGDIALLLSNSGETAELADIIAHCRRFDIQMIGICSNPASSMARQCDVAITLPPAPEACATGVVPTTSTMMMLALGDALAVALMETRDFTAEHFRTFHPGGKLGAKLLRVRDLMHTDLPLVAANCPMPDALLVISQMGFGVVGVLDAQGDMAGIITDGDLRRHMDGLMGLTADAVMTRNPRTLAPDALAETALALMTSAQITCVFVMDPDARSSGSGHPIGRAIGIVHIHDLLRAGVV
jgi:arabinose-5-phosphate isomerase